MSAPIDVAATQVGYHEGLGNDSKYGQALGLNHEPWCALFVSWCFEQAGHPLPSMQPGMPTGYAAVGYGIQWAKANGLWRPSWQAQPNDAICYGWDGPGSSWARMHTGLIVSAGRRGDLGHTIEGNRRDAVVRETFIVGSNVVLGVIALSELLGKPPAKPQATHATPEPQPRPAEHPDHTGPEDEMSLVKGDRGNAVRVFQQALQTWAKGAKQPNPLPKAGADGDFGTETETGVRAYQTAAQVPVTGVIDGLTAALLARYTKT